MQKKRILLFACDEYIQVCRMPRHLKAAGFQVAAVAREGNSLLLSTHLDKKLTFETNIGTITGLFPYLNKACKTFAPHIIIPCDEFAVNALNYLYGHLNQNDLQAANLKQLIRFSRGDPNFYKTVRHKHMSSELAAKIGIRIPVQMPCNGLEDIEAFAEEHDYPVVVKGAHGLAGSQVKILENFAAAQRAEPKLPSLGDSVIQQYIVGKTALSSAVALDGQVLAVGVYVKEACADGGIGYSTVVRFIEHPEIIEHTKKFARATKISGIFSLDFMLDDHNKSYFIECNPRPIETSHQGRLTGVDIFKGLIAGLNGQPYEGKPKYNTMIAHFPKEWGRDPNSEYLKNAIHDVPWDEPNLVEYFVERVNSDRRKATAHTLKSSLKMSLAQHS